MADRHPVDVQLTDEAFYAYAALAEGPLLDDVDQALDNLALFPLLGREYDPVYEATLPPVPCRVLYVDWLGIYYRVTEGGDVVVEALLDQHRDPLQRFPGPRQM